MASKKTKTEKWLTEFEKGPRVALARPAKKKKTLTLHENLEDALGVFKIDSDTPESIYDGAWEAKDHFMKEWIDDFSEDDTPPVAQIEAAEEAVDQAIQQAYQDSFQIHQGEALAQAAQYLADKTDAEIQFSYDRDKGQIMVELDQSFMKVWEEATTGIGSLRLGRRLHAQGRQERVEGHRHLGRARRGVRLPAPAPALRWRVGSLGTRRRPALPRSGAHRRGSDEGIMSYVLTSPLGEAAPPPEPTAGALLIVATCAAVCAPIALGAAGGFVLAPKSGAVAPVAGALVGALVAVLLARGKILDGSASVTPKGAL